MIPKPRKNEIDTMRIGVILFIATLLLIGCAHLEISKKNKAVAQVKPGDTKEAVFATLGPPDLRQDINDRRFVAFYQTKTGSSPDARVTREMCTPISFENGKVVSIGKDMTEPWIQEEEARKRHAEIAARERQQAEMAESARRQAETARREKIALLESKVRPVPVSNIALNLDLYRQLLELDPGNPRYQKKVAFYEERSAQREKARQERNAQAAKKRQKEAWEKAREERNAKLRQYSGNGTAEMAVHDMGSGSLYVWIKNVSRQIITTHPDHFTLIDSDGKKVSCVLADSLDSVLEPGSISHGKITFDPSIIPRELIFQNRESGRISKSFQ